MSKVKQFIKNISPLNNRTDMPAFLYVIKVILIFWFCKFGSELVGEAFAIGIHFACGKNPLEGELFDMEIITLISYYGYALMIVLILLYWKLFQKKTLSQLGFTKKFGFYFLGAAIGTVLIAVSIASVMLTGTITYNGIFSSIDYRWILLMFGGFIFQGALEEVLCRGIVLSLLKDRVPVPVAITVSTVLFVIPHIGNMADISADIAVFAVAGLILISVIFSLLTLRTKSLWAACGLHTFWNFILSNILGLNLSGNEGSAAAVFDMRSVGSSVLNGGIYGIEASAVTAVILFLAAVVFFIAYRSAKTNKTTLPA